MTQDSETAAPASTGRYDLVVIGANAAGLSVAISSQRSGIDLVRVIESTETVSFPELAAENRLDIGYGEEVSSIDMMPDGSGDLVVNTNRLSYRATACLVALRPVEADWEPSVPAPVSERVLIDELPDHADDQDLLVIGYADHAVELVIEAAAAGSRVVMAAAGMDPGRLSPAGEAMLRRLERERRATLLYRSVPDQIGWVDGYPMAYFNDRRTPDLQFDHVVFASARRPARPDEVGLSDEAQASGKVWFVGEPNDSTDVQMAPGWNIGPEIARTCFPEVDLSIVPSQVRRRARAAGVVQELRDEHYNATITHFEPTHSDLWVLRVRPDHGEATYVPGQYASLGLGFWEDRIDDAQDADLDERWSKLIRRSYSISSPMFDAHGYLATETGENELEFYIVLVKPSPDNVPALTPRLALKRPGDRVYLGPKIAGRYTLAAVDDPASTVVFLSTGTGEAPHNGMTVELLRKGHFGPIVSAVTVREWADLGYMDKHRKLQERYPNYHYLPLPTREADVPKRYIQDVIRDDALRSDFDVDLDPASAHVFLCGNPAMIGLPEGDDQTFPEMTGVVELLVERGFTLDRRGAPGNIHYEEYW